MAERPEDLNLPNSVVSRIIKEALPPNTKVSKEAQAAITKAASVFVLYATSCSNNVAQKSNKKTINGGDVIKAMEDMEFDKFVRPLNDSLDNWKETQQKKKDSAKQKREEKQKSAAKETNDAEDDDDDDDVIEVDPNQENKENQDESNNDSGDSSDEVQEVGP